MRVRVATLNTWALPEPFAVDTENRLESIGSRLADLQLDVAAFQEVWTKRARKRLVEAGRRAGLNHFHSRASIGESGLLTLSRWPIEDAHFEAFALRGNPDHLDNGEFLSGKGFARLRLRTENGALTLINTHLHARYTRATPHQYQAHRIGQIIQIATNVRDCEDPMLAVGDFNFSETHPEHGILTGLLGLRDSALELDRALPTVYDANPYRQRSNKPDKRVDLAFYRSGIRNSVVPVHSDRIFDEFFQQTGRKGAYSNHAGVLAEFEVDTAITAAATSPDSRVLALAQKLLRQGRDEAERRQMGGRTFAGAGLGCALLAGASMRNQRVSRRRLLRLSLGGAAVATLAPALGYSLLSEVFVPEEIQAFDAAVAALNRLRPSAIGDPMADNPVS